MKENTVFPLYIVTTVNTTTYKCINVKMVNKTKMVNKVVNKVPVLWESYYGSTDGQVKAEIG